MAICTVVPSCGLHVLVDYPYLNQYSGLDHLTGAKHSGLDHLTGAQYSGLDHLTGAQYSGFDHLTGAQGSSARNMRT